MDDDQLQQYRERHNASWDRIRHENASSVRSEPADPTSYVLQSVNFGTDWQYNNLNFHDQSLVLANNYGDLPPQQQILDYGIHHQNSQIVQVERNLEVDDVENDDDFEEDVDDTEEEEEEEEDSEPEQETDEVEHPDVFCLECDAKLDEPTLHDVSACARAKLSRFQCPTCQKAFNFEKNLKIHKILEHLKVIDFSPGTRCSFCPNDSFRTPFNRFSAYIGHLKIHVKPDFLTCDQCPREFEFERDLDHHLRRDHSDDLYELVYCPKCQKIITFEESKSHLVLHSAVKAVKDRQNAKKEGPKPSKKRKPVERVKKFACPDCPKAFVRPAELARHAAVHARAEGKAAAANPSPCSRSSSSLPPPPPKWKCAICAKEYAHEAGLLEHKRVAHGNARKIVCRVCGLIFTKKSNHDRHMSQIHPLDQDTKDRNKFECPDCPTVHNTLGALTRHKRNCHNQTTQKQQKPSMAVRHICRTCKREFREPEMLQKHRRTHVFSEYRWRDLQGGGERKCEYCEKSFVLRASLLWHQQKHFEPAAAPVPDTPPYCSICDLNFYSQLEFRQHLDEQHTIVCGICQQKFTSRQVYEDHICNRKFATRNINQTMPSNRVVICRLCRPPQRLTTYRQIKEHRARHLPRKTHLCWTCHKSFRTAQLLSLHAEVHDRQPVQCSHCPQVFHSRVALKQHTRLSHGGDTNYQCVVHVDRTMAMSAQSFAEYGLAADHSDGQARAHSVTEWIDGAQEEEQENHDNEHLQYQTLTNVNLANQQNQNPNQNAQGRSGMVPVEQQQPIRCEVCHHLYANIDSLCDHWQASDTDNDHSYAFVTCPVCELRIRGAADAAVHMRSVHLFARPRILEFMKSTGQTSSNSLALATIPIATASKKKHPCDHCNRSFARKNDLARHLKIHTGEKEFECPTCHATFREKSTLKSHMMTHSDNPPQFQCTVCQKAFYEKKTLVVHMRIHTGEQPFKCRYCEQHFRTTAMTRTHEKKCAYSGHQRRVLPDPTLPSTSSAAFQPQFVGSETEMNRTITQISTLPAQQLQLSRNSAFNTVQTNSIGGSDNRIYVITKPITPMEYVVIVQKLKPAETSMRYAVDTVSEIKIDQLHESTNLSIVLHNEMRLNLNTVKMMHLLHAFRPDDTYKTRVNVAQFGDENEQDLFSIIAHNKTSGSSFLRRCDICDVDLPTKRISDAHFYSEDHETAQLMYPSTTQLAISTGRNQRGANIVPAVETDFSCKLCGNFLTDMDSLLKHIREEHDDPVIRPRPVAHTAPIN